jgi:hypothetical protein
MSKGVRKVWFANLRRGDRVKTVTPSSLVKRQYEIYDTYVRKRTPKGR